MQLIIGERLDGSLVSLEVDDDFDLDTYAWDEYPSPLDDSEIFQFYTIRNKERAHILIKTHEEIKKIIETWITNAKS